MTGGCTRYRWRSLTPDQEASVIELSSRGYSARRLADEYGVARQTIYRVLRRSTVPTITVTVGDYAAPFSVGDEGPVQRGPWVARARARCDNGSDEYSVAIAHNAQRPASRLYSEVRGVDIPEYRRND